MSTSEAGTFPEEWPVEPLRRSLLSAVDGPFGSNLTSAHYVDDGARVIRLGNLGIGAFKDKDKAYISLEHFETLKGHSVAAGDLLVAGLGDENNPLGRASLAPASIEPAIVKADCFRLRLIPGRYDPRFVVWYLTSTPGQQQTLLKSHGSTRQRMNVQDVQSLLVPRPSLDEQRRIADFLNAETARIDELVETQTELSDLLRERRQSVAFAEVTGCTTDELRPSGLAWTDQLPSTWMTTKLSFVARMGSGHTPSRSRPEWWTDCTIPWITTGEVAQVRDDRREVINETREMISRLGMANSSAELHPQHTVVLCRTASAGYSGVMGRPMATSQDFVTWTCTSKLDPFYLLWCLRAMRSDLLGRLAMGSTHKTIYVPDLQMLKIPLPPVAEQRAIVERIRQAHRVIDELTDSVNSQLALLAERRQALITAAVTGQLDVTTARGADLS